VDDFNFAELVDSRAKLHGTFRSRPLRFDRINRLTNGKELPDGEPFAFTRNFGFFSAQ
jgi:hypothetical protein